MDPLTKTWRIIDMIKWAENYFAERGFSNPRREIEWLLQDALNCSTLDLYLRFDEPLEKAQLDTIRTGIKRRLKLEPIQYILGKTEFYGLPIKVNSNVLIPRPETERVIDVALHTLTVKNPRILDIGTGSGCIAIALAHELPEAEVVGLDVDKRALDLARENARALGLTNLRFEQMNILSENPGTGFDMVVSNPPYVSAGELESLMADVRDYEPHIALTDNADGLVFYRRFVEVIPGCLKPGGWMIVEVGLEEHPCRAMSLFQSAPFRNAELIPDYNGDARVLKVQLEFRS